ncbi:MAG: 3-oxoacyl-[acyl-carrier protein] reductase [Verrucomicrobiales bacterium]|jgi:3-oxoacyl-[acyl-carrier protein] reductase
MERISSRLKDKVAIVTGAAHGIGRVYALRLAAEGANVVIADLDTEGAVKVAKEITDDGGGAIGLHCDISDQTDIDTAVAATLEAFGRVDILVNNAGMFSVVPMSRVGFEDISKDEWDKMMDVNVAGVWMACKAVVPEMRKNGYGKIINISSGVVFKGVPTRVHYVASKAAVIGFTRTLAREVGGDNIMVNCIAPGGTLSEENPSPEMLEARAKKTGDRAIKRVQLPEDLAGAMAFFASPDSDFITGQTLVVDGGSAMH